MLQQDWSSIYHQQKQQILQAEKKLPGMHGVRGKDD
jgi:hypothetical protein